jgi:large subunit ribosomal protein L21
MYAIVKTGGKQYRVESGQRLLIERVAAEEGADVALEPVFYRSQEAIFEPEALTGVKVTARVLGHVRGPKLRVFKFKPKRGYKRRTGHRQELTRIEVTQIAHSGATRRGGEPAAKAGRAPAKAGRAPRKEGQPATKASRAQGKDGDTPGRAKAAAEAPERAAEAPERAAEAPERAAESKAKPGPGKTGAGKAGPGKTGAGKARPGKTGAGKTASKRTAQRKDKDDGA